MGNLIDLGPVNFPALSPDLTTVQLVDGPCAGVFAQVPGNVAECWQRIGKPGRVGVESQMWSQYERAYDGRWVYTGLTITTDQLQRAQDAAKAHGIEHGESYGA